MRKKHLAILLILPLIVMLSQQGCSQVSFLGSGLFSTSTAPSASETASVDYPTGNGGTYDGKLRILHHYVDQFTCEGRSQPESILIQQSSGWTIIQSTKAHCAQVDQAPITGVVYDEVAKVAFYNGNKYTPPHPYVVDPTEDANLPDIKLIDGVCEDKNFKCSLAAALANAGEASWTDDVSVIVPAGNYRFSAPITLSLGINNHNVSIQGAGPSSAIFDGQNGTKILATSGFSGQILIDGIGFQNGLSAENSDGAALTNLLSGKLQLKNSRFESNVGASALYTESPADLNISNTQFINNQSTAGGASLLIKGSTSVLDGLSVTGDTASGIIIVSGHATTIMNSYIANNLSIGISYLHCDSCVLQNTTITENGDSGVYLFQNVLFTDVFTMSNVTVYHNARAAGASANFSYHPFNGSTLNVSNSILSVHDSSKVDCNLDNVSSLNAVRSIFSVGDVTCVGVGSPNLFIDPLLGPPAMNGGLTPTMLPVLGSPAIDEGDNATCPVVDQRGLPRPVDKLGSGAKCDVGAVEVQ